MKRYTKLSSSLLALACLAVAIMPAGFAQRPTTIAVLDLKGHGDFVNLVREEVESRLKKEGYRLVVATSSYNNDMGHLQRELDVQNSKYGHQGDHHAPIGHFRGADLVVQGTVEHTIQNKTLNPADILVGVAGLTTQYKVLTVEVMLEIVDLKTREQLAHGRASASVRYSDESRSIATRTSYSKARRDAAAQAAEKATRQLLRFFQRPTRIK